MNGTELSLVDESTQELQAARATLKMSFATAYFICFVFGTIGNGIVIVMTINVLTSMHRGGFRRRSLSNTNHVFIYVLGLSIVDLLVILHLPFLIVDLLKGQWLFGQAMCKLYWFGESVNKLLSSFIMTVLSWDRYLAVCSPVKSMSMRSNLVAVMVLIGGSVLAVVLLLPVLMKATVFKLSLQTMEELIAGSPEERIADLHGHSLSKCMFESDATFVIYTFVMGYALPALLITAFYIRVIAKLQNNSHLMRRSSKKGKETASRQADSNACRVKQVTKRIVAVILFYYFCWTPQWTLNLLTQFNLLQVSMATPLVTSLFFGAHLLVCFNSAANPVLYALINRELRSQHSAAMNRKRQSISHATQTALEFVARHTHNFHFSVHGPHGRRTATRAHSLQQRYRTPRFRSIPASLPSPNELEYRVSTGQRSSLFSLDGKDGLLTAHLLPPITHIRHSIAGIKMNVFGNNRKPSNMSTAAIHEKSMSTQITNYPSESVLSSIARKEAEKREDAFESEDAFL